ncbi:NAD(P)-dependent oxidoreductase [Curtobacterium sp. VKM Ac-2922]|uniref:NAD(P)-dependent oxidoreductase n=1 Tax=Curtobacterium sp. VKM Ac-2922 TaxID=2929475 RepID=UPI001FB483F9|nr:NAD(P)H-binding protein [Curtobacterium sp. VKM Ac-2922]MCJ1712856.1 SDR family oxidoreductase [Curtobacterium sp. VKM Ac-2922]
MTSSWTFLVFGGTGQTGQHFVRMALEQGHRVRALARTPGKFTTHHPDLAVTRGSITDHPDLDALLPGVDAVVAMLGDAGAQQHRLVNTAFVRELVPAMRRHGVSRFLYQAGGLSAAPGKPLPVALRAVRATIARGYIGQHRDNEAVMRYLTDEAADLEWMVHRAGIGSDGPSKGVLQRSSSAISIGTFRDCADYTLRTVTDASAVHTCDPSHYAPAA